MLVDYKGSRVNYGRCYPKAVDLAVPGGVSLLPAIMRHYPYKWVRASNANYFGGVVAEGLMKDSGGTQYPTSNIWGRPSLFVRGNRAWYSYDDTEAVSADVAIGGGPLLVVDGVVGDLEQRIVRGSFSGLRQTNKAERCGIGMCADGTLLHAVADALTLYEFGQFFIEKGCTWAINLDGGGSVGLLEDGALTMGKAERRLPSAVVIREVIAEVENVSVQFVQDFIPVGRGNRPGRKMKPAYLTIHDTANVNKGADALAHAKYLKGDTAAKAPVSWHYTVDDKRIVQHLPWNETAYHAGDGSGAGNTRSIGIEICENADGDRAKAEDNAVGLIVDLLREVGLIPTNVVPHKFWTGKNCPRVILGRQNGWTEFMAKINDRYVGG